MPSEAEQRQIVERCTEIKEHTKALGANYRAKLNDISFLKQTILRKAFSGELTSPPSSAIKEAAE
jgi:type I restriction enzyme S subunit